MVSEIDRKKEVITISKMKKRIIIPTALALALILTSVYIVNQVKAEDLSPYPPIVQKIANRFGLKVDDVKEVFDQEKSDMWAKKRQGLEVLLQETVKDGKLTEDQKNKILEKRDELQADHKAQSETQKEELQIWAKENGINLDNLGKYLRFGGLRGRGYYHMKIIDN